MVRTHGVQVDSQTTDGQAPTNISRMDRYPNFLSWGDLLMEFHQFNGRVILASDQTTHNCTSLRLKSPDTSTLNASFFSRLFFLFYFFVYFILTIKFCFSLQSLFGKEADKLEQANDDDKTCILCFIRSINLLQFALPV